MQASEVNVDGDNLKDVLRFEAHLFAPSPIQSFSLILFYFCSIKVRNTFFQLEGKLNLFHIV